MSDQPGPGSDPGTDPDTDAGIEDILPLSPLAQGLLYHALYDENERDVYTLQAVMELEGELDGSRLAAAADALLARHANLRAAFLHEDLDEPVQAVLADVTARLSRVDLSDLDDTERERRVAEILAADEIARFDLADPPLLRLTAIRTGPAGHLLVVTTHHLLLDGWSLPLLVRDLLELYAAGADPAALPPVRPYRDFLAWLAAQDRDAAARTWQRALDGIEAPTLLAPAGTSRVPAAPEIVTLRLTEELTARLHRTAASLRITVNTMVQALWGLLLGRLTDRDDVVFGATVSGRPAELPGMESMVGLFINTVPCRVRTRAAEPVRELLQRLQREQAALLDVHHLALNDIQRSVGAGDLFDTLLVFENYPLDSSSVVDAAARGGLRLGEVRAGGATHYPLTLAVFDSDRLSIDFEARPDLFDRAGVATLAERFQRLLEQVLADAERPVASLDILSADERSALLDRGRRPAVAGAGTLVEAFEDQVERSPEAIAVVGQDRALSFAELNSRANRLARLLVERGAGPERVVALVLPPTPELIAAILAVLKAGAAYLPVDPSWPADRISLMLADAQPVAVLGTGAVTDHPAVAAHPGAVALDAPELTGVLRDVADHNLDAPRAALRPDHPAYVIYTSGSTGMPKAVVVPHRAIANLLAAHRDAILDPAWREAGRPLRVGHAWPTAFDASWQPMLWMFAGHELHLVPEDTRRDPALLRGFLAERGIEFIELSPTLLAEVASEPGWRRGLRVIAVGGEAVAPSLWDALRDEPGLRAVNLYGPTECTVDSAWCAVSDAADPAIGVPVAGASLLVLDRLLQPVPRGVTGELYIAGAGLARGYLHRPGATAARFVANPYAERPGALMYRTGDLARWNTDGVVECLGRGDDQVKIRGFRVEPGEIEAVLTRHEQVDRAAVVVRESGTGLRRLVAYVTPRDGATVVPARVREHVATVLPEHMVPAAVVAVDAFPLTRNGKLDVAALPEPDASSAGGRHEPPRTGTEHTLAAVFAEVLGVDSVGVHDSFFALGGDSIASMRLVSRARAAGLSLSPRDVFERRTVAGLAAHAETTERAGGRRPSGTSGVGEVPLTPILHWLVEQGAPFERLCQGRVVVTPSDLDTERVAALVEALLDRHDVLRATFRHSGTGDGTGGDGWAFTTRPAGSVDAASCVRRVDVRGTRDGQLADLLPRLFGDAAAELDPAAGVLARFVWCDAGREVRGRLLIVLHHLVVDAASWQTVVADLAEAWPTVRRGERYRPRPAGTPVREWAIGLREEARRPGRGAELDLWRDVLGTPDPVLGRRRLDPAADTGATVRSLQVALDPRRTEPLVSTLPDQHGVTVQDVLLTALARALARLRGTGDTAVLIALEGHGREEHLVPHAQLSEAVGWFTSVFPVRLDPGDPRDTGTSKALRRVAEQRAELPDKGIGYGLLRYLNPDTTAELTRFDGPQLEFNYLGKITLGGRGAAQDWSLDLRAGALADADPRAPAPYSLVVDAAMVDEGDGTALRATLQWPAGILDAPDIDLLVEYWFSELDDLAAGDAR